jgi:hypothetical protein
MRRRVLIVTDSMGSDFGARGYAAVAKAQWDAAVDVVTYAGLPIFMVAADLHSMALADYDVAIVQLGVPDVTSRFPLRIMQGLRKIGLKFVRESFFFVPPRFGMQWIAKLPLFVVRLVITRVYRASYTPNDDLVEIHRGIVERLRQSAARVLVLPVFEVSRVYGRDQGRRARDINQKLAASYGPDFVRCPALEPGVYGRFRNHDFFHFRDAYHQLLAGELEPIVLAAAQPDQRDRLTS